ncbi:MAG TPA: IS1634 family transposase, partial [bacterium]|nr:IS1634 family transposase [bacterium]
MLELNCNHPVPTSEYCTTPQRRKSVIHPGETKASPRAPSVQSWILPLMSHGNKIGFDPTCAIFCLPWQRHFKRALDALTSERGRSIWFRLALRIIKQFELDTHRFHHDTTTVTFHGAYAGAHGDPQITHGHNKDHRPDLKQLVFGLTATADGAVPVWHDVFSGHRTDDTVHRSTVDALRAIVGRAEFIYVADCKLCTVDNLRHIAQYGGQFVTVMPRTWKEDQQFRARLREQGIRWHPILTIPNRRRKADPPDVFSSCAGTYTTADGYRIIWVRSSQKATENARGRERRLAQAQTALRELNDKLPRRRDHRRPAIQR